MARLAAACPHCGQKHVYQSDFSGTIRRCSNCGRKFQLPSGSGCLGSTSGGCMLAALVIIGVCLVSIYTASPKKEFHRPVTQSTVSDSRPGTPGR